ncbi:MAG TPA: peptide ABC transporter substrate-binding protein, partial [Xanthobacteraceae bacterium]
MRRKLAMLLVAGLTATAAANAQQPKDAPKGAPKHGGIFRIYHRETPGGISIHEEATFSTNTPMMGVFNNLVIYDQHKPQNSLDTIVPELATGW